MVMLVFHILLGIGIMWDLVERRIPNTVTLSLILGGMAFHLSNQGISGGCHSVLGMVAGVALLLPVYAVSGMGAGDVKFLGGIGAYLGWKGVLTTSVYMGIFGGIYAIILLLLHREYAVKLFRRMGTGFKAVMLTRKMEYALEKTESNGPVLCYGLPIGLGAIAFLAEPYLGIHLLGAF